MTYRHGAHKLKHFQALGTELLDDILATEADECFGSVQVV